MRGGPPIREGTAPRRQTVNIICLAPTLLNDVVESPWRVDAGFAWHGVRIAEHDRVGKLYFYGRPPFRAPNISQRKMASRGLNPDLVIATAPTTPKTTPMARRPASC